MHERPGLARVPPGPCELRVHRSDPPHPHAQRGRALFAVSLALLALCAGVAPRLAGSAADPDRGRSLYEVRCTGCHEQSVHNRQSRLAKDFEGVRAQVRRWDGNLGSRWGNEEIDAVAVFLNMRYYGFPCPLEACPPVRSREGSGPAPLARGGS